MDHEDENYQSSVTRGLAAEARREADAQALADVRTLDGWQASNRLDHEIRCGHTSGHEYYVLLRLRDREHLEYGTTPDEARAAAAAWARKHA